MSKNRSTILTQPIVEEFQKEQDEEQRLWDVASHFTESLLASYIRGEITFIYLCETTKRILRGRPEYGRQRILGNIIERALNEDPPKNKKNKHEWVKQTIKNLVPMVSDREKLPIAMVNNKKITAFDKVSIIFADHNHPLTCRQIYDIYYCQD